ncbi:hypothetical protein GCM10010174_69930 [Kutzneria viridogrisea]|uniref:Transcriptional regulator with XRE-family HTH domain n=1 Tax=Kutzneria viridogrisea TaxID=47990 RepID=A0ABR6BAZ2_9PSEU|nr:transcriptional regulator with XRE-family HTH domain [Kutzneria viridogrisea]
MNIDISRATAANIRRFRRQRGWTVQHLASVILGLGGCVTGHSIAQIETKPRHRVTIDQAVWFARAFGVPITLLVDPTSCERCKGMPPAGFTCNDCGVAG